MEVINKLENLLTMEYEFNTYIFELSEMAQFLLNIPKDEKIENALHIYSRALRKITESYELNAILRCNIHYFFQLGYLYLTIIKFGNKLGYSSADIIKYKKIFMKTLESNEILDREYNGIAKIKLNYFLQQMNVKNKISIEKNFNYPLYLYSKEKFNIKIENLIKNDDVISQKELKKIQYYFLINRNYSFLLDSFLLGNFKMFRNLIDNKIKLFGVSEVFKLYVLESFYG